MIKKDLYNDAAGNFLLVDRLHLHCAATSQQP
jgi:hypothetical protein